MHGLLKVGTMIHLKFRDVYLQLCRSIPKPPLMEGTLEGLSGEVDADDQQRKIDPWLFQRRGDRVAVMTTS